ncbi:hypothetical protein F0L74_05930 [Chitinophaga agrisoli]|uniref:Uncharacterized protein n=1 Tax=Chitinophaga agrisoli TaxID=2607653 RepID=A0A5B2W2A1_9BACT|nr:hypothetical protein [Chitinophaga agrisoli]KAA2245495.1 hypothetical protein F0L74_05930 [Chitinophaga agrisoli]
MNNIQAIDIASKLFPNYPSVDAFHITSDGQAFQKDHQAGNHARSFKVAAQQRVIIVTREECESYNNLEHMTAELTDPSPSSLPGSTLPSEQGDGPPAPGDGTTASLFGREAAALSAPPVTTEPEPGVEPTGAADSATADSRNPATSSKPTGKSAAKDGVKSAGKGASKGTKK